MACGKDLLKINKGEVKDYLINTVELKFTDAIYARFVSGKYGVRFSYRVPKTHAAI